MAEKPIVPPDSSMPNLGGGVAGITGGAGGQSSTVAAVRSKFTVDTEGIKKLKASFDELNVSLKETRDHLEAIAGTSGAGATAGKGGTNRGIASASRNAAAAGGGAFGGLKDFARKLMPGYNPRAVPGAPLPTPTPGMAATEAEAAAAGAPSGVWSRMSQVINKQFPGGTKGAAVGAALYAASKVAGAVEGRLESAQDYALAANKVTMISQLRGYGDRLTIDRAVRSPLANLMLGPREDQGPSQIQAFQQRFGGDAMQIGRSVEAMRVVSGFQLGVGDILQRQEALGQANVNNRMQQRLGTGMYGPGGKQKSVQQVYEDIIKRTNFTKRQWETGRQPGSNLQMFLQNMGVPPDMIEEVINYALQNIGYQEKLRTATPEQLQQVKGQSTFFRATEAQNKFMGITDEFPYQREKRFQTETERDEDFQRKQSDNYATAEMHVRKMNSLYGYLEEHLSGVIGAFSDLNSILGGGGKGGGGGLAGAARGAATGALIGSFVPLPGATIIGGLLGGVGGAFGMFGDPVAGEKSSGGGNDPWHVPPPQPGAPWAGDKGSRNGWDGLTTTMKSRLDKMLNAAWQEGRKVWVGQGFRSEAQQKKMFLERYRRTSKKTKTQWDGSYWEHVTGAAAAPPGRSMHEIGLAADLAGDMDWVVANANRFGLKHFAGVNNEPWHVQPSELPDSRRSYEKAGGSSLIDEETGIPDVLGDNDAAGDTATAGYTGLGSISIAADVAAGLSRTGSRSSGGGSGVTSSSSGSTMTTSPTVGANGKMNPADVARMLYQAGFRGEDIVNLVAISGRESIGWNPRALNPDHSSGDQSYGLFQINMLGKMGIDRMKIFGLNNVEQLYDPWTNIVSMKKLFEGSLKRHGTGYWDWGPYKGVSPFRNVPWEKARAAVAEAGVGGDPEPVSSRRPSSTSTMSGATINSTPVQLTVAPVFNISVQQLNDAEAQRFGERVAEIAKDQISLALARSN